MSRNRTAQEANPEKYFNSPKGHPRDRIVIHESSDIAREGQFMSLNGYSFLVKPGVEVDLPRPVRLMLDTRIRTETLQDENGKEYRRDIPRITYTMIKEDVQAEEEEEKDLEADPFADGKK